jgi:hypothetical protein
MLKVKVREGFVCWISFSPITYYVCPQEFNCTIEQYWQHAHQLEILEGDPDALAQVASVDESAVSSAVAAAKTTSKSKN